MNAEKILDEVNEIITFDSGRQIKNKWLRKAEPNQAFWSLWKSSKQALKDAGVSVSKYTGNWEVCLWQSETDRPAVADVKLENKIKTEEVELPDTVESKLLDFQINHVKAGVRTLAENGSILDASFTGSGKTFSTIAIAAILDKPIFIICPKAVIANWPKAAKHFNYDKLITAINYEKLRTGNTEYLERIEKTNKKGKKTISFKWNLPEDAIIVFDEVHKTKNNSSLNAKMLIAATKQNYLRIMLSATVADKPNDLYAVGNSLGLFKSNGYYPWLFSNGCERVNIMGRQIIQFKGDSKSLKKQEEAKKAIKNLHYEIFASGKGIKLKKSDIPDFPETQILADPFYMNSDAKKIEKIYREMQSQLSDLWKKSRDDKESHLTIMLRARQKIELLKVPLILERIQEAHENGFSVAVFCNFNETIKTLKEKLKTDMVIQGSDDNGKQQKSEERNEIMSRFQNNEERTILLNIEAGGTGIDLHDTNGKYPRKAIISPPWSGQTLTQALGRVNRAGGKSVSQQELLFVADTVEERVANKVNEKIARMNALQDGEFDSVYNENDFK